jgi:RNA recognition motif-containing protein
MEQRKIYVGNLDYQVTSKDLVKLFSQFGEVLEAMVIPDKSPEKSKGYGFVTFALKDDAMRALQLNGTKYRNRNLVVSMVKSKSDANTKSETVIYENSSN